MTIEQIVELGYRILTIVGYVILAILAIKRKKPTVVDNSDSEQTDNFTDELLGFIVSEIKAAEEAGESLLGKSGFFKFDRVLAHAKDFCRDNGVTIDNAYLTERIEALVKLMNFKSNRLDGTVAGLSEKIDYEEDKR